MTDISYSWARDIYRIIIHSHFPAIIVKITIIPTRARRPNQWFLFYRGSIFEQVVTRTGGADPRQIDAKTSALMRRQSHGMGYKLMLIPAVKLMLNPALKLCLVDVLKASYVIVQL